MSSKLNESSASIERRKTDKTVEKLQMKDKLTKERGFLGSFDAFGYLKRG